MGTKNFLRLFTTNIYSLENIRVHPTSLRHRCACEILLSSTNISINKPAVIRACWQCRNRVNFCNFEYVKVNYSWLERCVVNAWWQRIKIQFISWIVVSAVSNHELSRSLSLISQPYFVERFLEKLIKVHVSEHNIGMDFLVPCDTTFVLLLQICLDKPGRV